MEESNFHSEISFSESISSKRIQSAYQLLGRKTVNRIIGIALFWLGGNREKISEFLNIPIGTFFSFLTRFQQEGVKALKDQRVKPEAFKVSKIAPKKLKLVFGEHKISLNISPDNDQLVIDPPNILQFKILILSFMDSGFLSAKEVSEQLGISERHARDLSKNLRAYDIKALLDKRRGQQKEYAFNEGIKAEIIQQFVVNLINKRPTVSSRITQQVNDVCHTSLSERAMRKHLSKLGLHRIKDSLPKLLEDVKKNDRVLDWAKDKERRVPQGDYFQEIHSRRLWRLSGLCHAIYPGIKEGIMVLKTNLDSLEKDRQFFISNRPSNEWNSEAILNRILLHWDTETGVFGIKDNTFQEDKVRYKSVNGTVVHVSMLNSAWNCLSAPMFENFWKGEPMSCRIQFWKDHPEYNSF
jgi:hypothetical protein